MSTGLSAAEARQRLAEVGPNELARAQATSPWTILLAQFKSALIALLAVATAVSFALGETADAIAIAVILVINALVGFFQEYRAERTVLALRSLTAPRARVVRDDATVIVAAHEVVPGDLLLLEAGEVVAADGQLLEAYKLATQEAALTGESAQVEKSTTASAPDAPLAERRDRVFMGTHVARGTGVVRVTATGMATEIGTIAHLLEGADAGATPLQQRLARVGRVLLAICLGIVALVGVVGLLRGEEAVQVFMSAVSLAVAAVPEGLPAVVTIALAIGVQRMAARNVLVRKLPSVETLGCTTVICTDKTGTLTTGVMTVRKLWGPDHVALLDAAAACCDAELGPDDGGGVGDTTELAILTAAAQHGIRREDIERARPRVAVEPFDADTKRMAILRADGKAYVKGALEVLLEHARAGTEGISEAAAEMAERGLRVLAVGVARDAGGELGGPETLELLGVIGIADPPRREVIAAIQAARQAGVQPVMITGDHPMTARAIARELGLVRAGDVEADIVHARATPADKIRIVREWKQRGAIVAMTGDGVNDAPALCEAHIGIAMGRTGTEVTREASDMVLADDNFASIVAAIREGRGIFDNIRKTLVYLLSGNFAELLVMFAAAVAGLPLPLLPLQILWINLMTDGLPALALVMDPPDEDVLARPPRGTDEAMLGRAEWRTILWTGLLQAAAVLGAFAWTLEYRGLEEARDVAFSALVFGELLRAFAARSPEKSFWETGVFTNVLLLAVVAVSFLLQLGLHYIPFTQDLFGIGRLSLDEGLFAFAIALCPVTVLEVSKFVRRIGRRRGTAV